MQIFKIVVNKIPHYCKTETLTMADKRCIQHGIKWLIRSKGYNRCYWKMGIQRWEAIRHNESYMVTKDDTTFLIHSERAIFDE